MINPPAELIRSERIQILRRALASLAVIAATTITVAACGTEPTEDPTPAAPEAAAPAATEPATSTEHDTPEAPEEQETPADGQAPATADGEITLGPLSLTDHDGYTSDFDLRMPRWNFIAQVVNAKPGEADLKWTPPFDYAATLTNTTEGRRTPGQTVTMYGIYPAGRPACAPELDPESVEDRTDLCTHKLMIFEPSAEAIDVGGTLPLWQFEQREYGAITNRDNGWDGLPEDLAEVAGDSLTHDVVGYTIHVWAEELTGGDCDLSSPESFYSVAGFGEVCPA